ncbi:MAG: sugar phosphate isomerase/epimerase family protein [Chryseolinea sp.]
MIDVKFGVSTWLWTSPFTTESASLFPLIKSMGYDAVEIAVEDAGKINAQKISQALKDYELKAVVCVAFGPDRDLTHEDAQVHRATIDYVEQCFELCNAWNADFLAGPMYSAVGKARMVSTEQKRVEWDRAVTNLYQVGQLASKRGLCIALEPLNRFESDLVNTADDVMRLVGDINHKSAKVLLDGFHMSIEENDLERAITTVGDKLIHMQVSENHRGVPGTGQTQWKSLKRGLENINYKGVVSIESFTPDNKELAEAVSIWRNFAANQNDFAIDGLAFLRQLLND